VLPQSGTLHSLCRKGAALTHEDTPSHPDSHSTNEVGASDLTTVELLWLESASRTAFGLVGRFRRKSWTASARAVFRSRQHFSLSCVGRHDFGPSCPHRYFARGDTRATLFDRPWITPGGESLLRLSGWPKVERVLQLIDVVEAIRIDPADAAPDYCTTFIIDCRQRNTSAIHTIPPPGLAPSPEGAA